MASTAMDVDIQDERQPPPPPSPPSPPINRFAFLSLLGQHFSVTWSQRTVEFATYLFLIDLFPTTLLPSALYGFFSTFAGVILGGTSGGIVDQYPRLRVVRVNIFINKIAITVVYTFLLVLMLKIPSAPIPLKSLPNKPLIWSFFSSIVLSSCILKLSDIVMSVAIERDWVTTIASGNDDHLTYLNLWMRRIDLFCKLLAPLFVGLLTTAIGDFHTVLVLLGVAVVGLFFEFVWIGVVWARFPCLHTRRIPVTNIQPNTGSLSIVKSVRSWSLTTIKDWKDFSQSSVFPSSIAISLLYFTTLSFDGTMISWLKTNKYPDILISGMRGISVCTGLMGTILMPILEKRIGLARAGSWSIWSEAVFLVPVLTSFFINSPQGSRAPAWNQALLFGGMALSRIGLWSFDLCQLKLLQVTLADHPRRNRFNGLQFSLQNILDLLRYVMVIVLSQPREFKYTAAVSFGAVVLGASSYLVYLHKERGHIAHWEWLTYTQRRLQRMQLLKHLYM